MMSEKNEKKIPKRPTKNFPGPEGEPNPCYDYFMTIDRATGSPVAVLLTQYLNPDKVVVERVFTKLGIKPEEEMTLEEFEKEKRISSGKEFKKVVSIPGLGVYEYTEALRTINESGDETVYVLKKDDEDPEKIEIIRYFHDFQGYPTRTDMITTEKLKGYREDNEKLRKLVTKEAWLQVEARKKESKTDERRDVM